MEVLNLIRLFWGWCSPYISLFNVNFSGCTLDFFGKNRWSKLICSWHEYLTAESQILRHTHTGPYTYNLYLCMHVCESISLIFRNIKVILYLRIYTLCKYTTIYIYNLYAVFKDPYTQTTTSPSLCPKYSTRQSYRYPETIQIQWPTGTTSCQPTPTPPPPQKKGITLKTDHYLFLPFLFGYQKSPPAAPTRSECPNHHWHTGSRIHKWDGWRSWGGTYATTNTWSNSCIYIYIEISSFLMGHC